VTSPTEIASSLTERLGVQGTPNLSLIAQRIGLRIQEVDAEAFEGTLVRALDGPKGIIGVNRSIRENTRKRFTIAHEIGHYLIPSHRVLENVCESAMVESWQKGLARPEIEANEFAIELLLPARLVRDSLKLADPSLHTIRRIADEYETSLTATACRFVDLTNLACVVVWSEGKRTKWCRPSHGFPFYFSTEGIPSEGSFAYRLFEKKPAPHDLAEAPPEAWLDRRDAERVARLFEHSIFLPNYEAVLSLLWCQFRDLPDEESTLEDLDPEEFTLNRKRWPR
jgi:Zn-dependent peptidase ImmA (M78 family)